MVVKKGKRCSWVTRKSRCAKGDIVEVLSVEADLAFVCVITPSMDLAKKYVRGGRFWVFVKDLYEIRGN